MNKPIVALTAPIHPAGVDLLEGRFEIRHAYHHEVDQAAIDDAVANAFAVVVRSAPITAEAIGRSTDLTLISKHGAGLDSVDMDAATRAGVLVSNTGLANSGSVAEHAVALILGTLHDLLRADATVRRGAYLDRDSLVSGDLTGATVGLVGFGNISRRVAQICQGGFGCRVIAFDPFVEDALWLSTGVERAQTIDELMANSDVVSVHAPLTPSTRHMIGAEQLRSMQPQAVIVNTSRGGVIDETALGEALAAGRIRAAGLDVLESEPPTSSDPLVLSDRTLLSPHIAGGSAQARIATARAACQAIIDAADGRLPAGLVNSDVLQVGALRFTKGAA